LHESFHGFNAFLVGVLLNHSDEKPIVDSFESLLGKVPTEKLDALIPRSSNPHLKTAGEFG
jgi:hypothetical protein